MRASYFKTVALQELLDPMAADWSKVNAEHVTLVGTPVNLQPTAYIRSKWADKQPGKVSAVQVKAMHNGQTLAFHLCWQKPDNRQQSNNDNPFPDGAAIALNTGDSSSFQTMGVVDNPLNIWHWRADASNAGRHVIATGFGTTDAYGEGAVKVSSKKTQNGWQVVIARSLKTVVEDGAAQLNIGDEIELAIAIWDGSNNERAGLKAFSPDPLTIKLSDKQG